MTNDSEPLNSDSGSSGSDDMAQYLQVYIDESEEELDGLIGAILELEVDPHRSPALQKAFRMLHSLKGSSGMMGFEAVGNLAHELEDRFERYRSGQSVLDRETTTLILKCIDYFREFLNRLSQGDSSERDPAPLLDQLRHLATGGTEDPTPQQQAASETLAQIPTNTMSGGLRLTIRFRSGLQLADLKARLIVSRLSAIGEIVGCDPPIDDAHSFEDLALFSLILVTEKGIEEVRRIANVDGVDSIEIPGSEPTAVVSEAIATETTVAAPADLQSDDETAAPAVVSRLPDDHQEMPISSPTNAEMTRSESDSVKPSAPGRDSTAETSGARSQTNETLRVEIGRLDDLMNLTGELVVMNARFSQISGRMSPLFRRNSAFTKPRELTERLRRRFEQAVQLQNGSRQPTDAWSAVSRGLEEDLNELDRQTELWDEGHRQFAAISDAVDQLTRVSKNLQRGVLKTRMVPVGPLFSRFKRVIRDLSVERGKQVQLSIHGEKTELDKRMIDALGDPLLHLVRNSLDHGLESQEQRRAIGKPEAGTISMEAAHRGNNVLITIRDDGAGINTEKIRARIVERGFAAEAVVRDMTDQEVMEYIWHPGFSTAESITEISGRGVGMDIVRSAISDLSGTIDVASTPGKGTMFTVRLPLTLAIIHSLLMQYEDDFFSIPIEDVREIVSIPRDEVHVVHRHVTIEVRGQLIPLVSMANLFTWQSSINRSTASHAAVASSGAVNVVVVQSRGKTLGLSVDSLVGRGDLVIKSLSENFYPVRGLSGASILGDGAVCLMLDSAALIEMASERAQSGSVR